MSAGLKKRRGTRWPCGLKHRFFLISLVTFCIKAESNARPARPKAGNELKLIATTTAGKK
jgi:hypothetical protein